MRSVKLKRILQAAAVIGLVAGAECFARFSFDGAHMADAYRYEIRQLKEQDEDVDMFVVGSSQIYYGSNPGALAEAMGFERVVNVSGAHMLNTGQYYQMKSFLETFHPKVVVIEKRFYQMDSDFSAAYTPHAAYLAMDQMDTPTRLELMRDPYAFPFLKSFAGTFSLYRDANKLLSPARLVQNLRERIAVGRGGFSGAEGLANYAGYGFFRHGGSVDPTVSNSNALLPSASYTDGMMSEKEKEYVTGLVRLCQDAGAQAVMVTFPDTAYHFLAYGNYMEAHRALERYAQELGIGYLDFNLLKDRETILPDSMFKNETHLNAEGSDVFAPILADAVQKVLAGESTDDLFYKDVEEYRQTLGRIAGTHAGLEDQGDGIVHVSLHTEAGPGTEAEYRLCAAGEDGVFEEIVPYTDRTEMDVDVSAYGEDCSIEVEVRRRGEADPEIRFVSSVQPAGDGVAQSESSEGGSGS